MVGQSEFSMSSEFLLILLCGWSARFYSRFSRSVSPLIACCCLASLSNQILLTFVSKKCRIFVSVNAGRPAQILTLVRLKYPSTGVNFYCLSASLGREIA